MRDFRKLKVWAKSHALALEIYRATSGFPSEERYGLTSQLRRAAVSVPTNIAEGSGRKSEGDLGRYLTISMGSASELEYLLMLSGDLGFLDSEMSQRLLDLTREVKRMLSGFLGALG